MSIINNIPRDVLNAVIEANKVGSYLFPTKDVEYLNMLKDFGYIKIIEVSDFETKYGHEEYCVSIIKSLK